MCDSIGTIAQDWTEAAMKTVDEMLHLALLTPDEHQQISSWIAQADSPDEYAGLAVAGRRTGQRGHGHRRRPDAPAHLRHRRHRFPMSLPPHRLNADLSDMTDE